MLSPGHPGLFPTSCGKKKCKYLWSDSKHSFNNIYYSCGTKQARGRFVRSSEYLKYIEGRNHLSREKTLHKRSVTKQRLKMVACSTICWFYPEKSGSDPSGECSHSPVAGWSTKITEVLSAASSWKRCQSLLVDITLTKMSKAYFWQILKSLLFMQDIISGLISQARKEFLSTENSREELQRTLSALCCHGLHDFIVSSS